MKAKIDKNLHLKELTFDELVDLESKINWVKFKLVKKCFGGSQVWKPTILGR